MCIKRFDPPEMLPYVAQDRESALRLIAQERFEMMVRHRNKSDRRILK